MPALRSTSRLQRLLTTHVLLRLLLAASLISPIAGCSGDSTTDSSHSVHGSTTPTQASATAASGSVWSTNVTSFVHPGIGLNAADLEQFKTHVTNSEQPWLTAYNSLKSSSLSQLSYTMQGPFSHVSRNPDVNLSAYVNDMQAAYNLTLMWYMTGNTAYADKAIGILDAWSTINVLFDGAENFLAAGDYVTRSVVAAEILRALYPGWTDTNTQHMKSYLANIYWPIFWRGGDSLGAGDLGAGSLLRPANQGGDALQGAMAVAVFLDDSLKFDQVVNAFLTDPEGLNDVYANGEVGDTGRDQGHAWGQIFHYAFIAETAWKQGVDIYSQRSNVLHAAGEFFSNFNLGNSYSYTPIGSGYNYYTAIGGPARSDLPNDMLNLLYTAYAVRQGLASPYLTQFKQVTANNADGGLSDGTYMSMPYLRSTDTSTAKAVSTPAWSEPSTTAVTSLNDADLGTFNTKGVTSNSGGTWTITASGAGPDQGYHFAYQTLSGDAEIVAKVTSPGSSSTGGRAGIMIRSGLDANSSTPYAFLYLKPNAGAQLFWRVGTEVYYSNSQIQFSSATEPKWVKLVRRGNFIYAYLSENGSDWSPMGNINYALLPDKLYVGLAVCSGDTTATNTSTFESVQTGTQLNSLAASPTGLTASASGGNVTLNWTASSGTRYYDVQRSTTSGSGYSTVATAIQATTYADTAPSGSTYYYVVKAANYSGRSAASNEVTVTP